MGRLDGKIAIVTGGAQGIGEAYARGLAAEGARVAIADIDSGAKVVEEITRAGGQALDVPTDVSDEASCMAMAAKTVARLGGLHILVNNAAAFTSLERQSFTDIPVELWDRVMAVNTRGVFLCAKACAPHMRAQKYGKIINIATGRFFQGVPMFLHYDASKGAVIAMTKGMARELGADNICVNCLAPGSTMSENVKKKGGWVASGRGQNDVVAGRALKRLEEPEDLVGACLFLASPDSDFVTGQTLLVDGGVGMH
jgi:NAD(P)-dependent dehydrogenase (short-subunit alcohol dehydrogenase family)